MSPIKPNNRFAIAHFHGGGHTQAMNGTYRKVAERFCKISGCSVFSIDYKTGNELVYPSVHNECFSAYIGLLSERLKSKRIIAVGDSFGANLTLSTCLKLRDRNIPLPNALICISSYIDLAATGNSYKKNCYRDPLYGLTRKLKFEYNEKFIRRITPYCGQTSYYNTLLSPAYAEFQDFPETLIQCGDLETSESDSDTLYEKMLNAGVKVKLTKYNGMWHDFQYLAPFLKESKMAWKEIEQFIDSVMRKNKAAQIQ
ncbi:MAG: alpha/beta hydrolase [Clostridia bacterium]|nr:alpha/beta hydrolase [Clostridia bacterium]MDE7328576.1 alpha/beta hydrolase [Clostridia bacterium]